MRSMIIALLISSWVHAEPSPSVWEQMQTKNVIHEDALIESVEVTGSKIIVGFTENGQSQTAELCRDIKNEPHFGVTFENQRVEMLRVALKSGERVQLGLKGPWSPCLDSVKISKAQ